METVLPPGYPADLECDLTLADGRLVHVRPILPSDASALAEAIATADAETLRMRFLGGGPPTRPALIRRMCEVDYRYRLALVAFAAGTEKGVGIARYEGRPGSDEAEVAIAVDVGWRGVGLATQLLTVLVRAAMRRGIGRFRAVVLPENVEVFDLLDSTGLPQQRRLDEGVVEEVVTVTRQSLRLALDRAGVYPPEGSTPSPR